VLRDEVQDAILIRDQGILGVRLRPEQDTHRDTHDTTVSRRIAHLSAA